MTKDEALKMAQDACPYFAEQLKGAFYEGFITALDQLPDTTKMIDMGIDRGAWSDVPDATKWVDELRGEDDELPPVKTYCGGKPNYCEPEEPSNSTTDVVESEPVAYTEIKDGYPKSWLWNPEYVKANPNAKVKLYAAPPKREWVGLSYEDVVKAKELARGDNPEYAVAFVTFRLKEYNT